MATYPLQILGMDKVAFEAEVESLVAPGIAGFLGVLAHHAPLITELAAGVLEIRESKGQTRKFRIQGGLLEVGGNKAIVLADGSVEEL